MAHVDFGLAEMLKKMDNMTDKGKVVAIKRRTLKRLGAKALARAKKLTPVITGNLQKNWTVTSDDTKAVLENITEYAPHVNYGHRQGSAFVSGQFILEKALGQTAKQDMKPELTAAMADILGGFK